MCFLIWVLFAPAPLAFSPPELPGANLLELIERIDLPTAARFSFFSSSCDAACIFPGVSDPHQLRLRVGPLSGITTPELVTCTEPARPVWESPLRACGIRPCLVICVRRPRE
jgi:hypothetical protein